LYDRWFIAPAPTELITAILVNFRTIHHYALGYWVLPVWPLKTRHARLHIKKRRDVVAAIHMTGAAIGKVWPQPD